jgi:hypothetical protein
MSGFRLTAQEARDLMDIKKESFEKTLSIIRQMCDVTMRDSSRRGIGNMKFDVPQTVWGRDGYNQHAMGKALAEQLFDDGFDVTGTTTKLNISWGAVDAADGDRPITGLSCGAKECKRGTAPLSIPFTPTFAAMMRNAASGGNSQKKKKIERHVNISSY